MIIKAIQTCLQNTREKGWDKTYWAFDIHGTIIRPNYMTNEIALEFYPFAMEAMQLISKHEDIVKILYTCSYPHEIVQYKEHFERNAIHFHYVNENPEINNGAYGYYENKFYFNVLLEDKAGFDPMNDWERILKVMSTNNKL
jgi:hypothetical protein